MSILSHNVDISSHMWYASWKEPPPTTMKKKDIISLIRSHVEGNEASFRNTALIVADYFSKIGDTDLAEYIMSLLSNANTFVPQEQDDLKTDFLQKVELNNSPLYLPERIQEDIIGLSHALASGGGINKILFQGAPGTGKTESVKHLARILKRDLYAADFSHIVDSKLGQTTKNLSELFDVLATMNNPERIIVLFDEIDSIALDRTNSQDIREMGRVTSTLLKELDNLDERIIIVATTNLFSHFDRALIRRFDFVLSFNRYTHQDLMEIAEKFYYSYVEKYKFVSKNVKLFRKIVKSTKEDLSPGELKNIIKTSIALSNRSEEFDYLRRLYKALVSENIPSIKELQDSGYSLREIEILSGVSKSTAARELK